MMSVDSPSLSDVFETWIYYMADIRRRSPHTLETYRRYVGDCLRFLDKAAGKHHTLDDIGDVDIALFRGWAADLARRNLSARSAATALSAVRSFFSYLERKYDIKDSAIFSLKAPRRSRLLPKPALKHDIFRLIDSWQEAFPNDSREVIARDVALCALLYGTGMRISEALSLNAGDVTKDTTSCEIIGKGGKRRRVILLVPIQAHILHYKTCACMGDSTDMPLFKGVRGGRLGRTYAAKRMQIARRILGAGERFTPHALRHAFATDLLAEGGDLRIIQELLGHASVSATQIYTKVSDKVRMDAVLRHHPRARLQ